MQTSWLKKTCVVRKCSSVAHLVSKLYYLGFCKVMWLLNKICIYTDLEFY